MSTEQEQMGSAYFEASGELLAQLFGFPVGSAVDRIDNQLDRPNTFTIHIKSPLLKPLPEGCFLERISPTYQSYYVKAGEVALQDAVSTKLVSW